ncbi:MAG TPA: sulfite exporter TauE/SafE family protein, partial [Chthoniobacterales bacterium]
MFLEIATTFGAIIGAYLATRVPTSSLAVVFGLVLLYSAYLSLTAKDHLVEEAGPAHSWADKLRLNSEMPVKGGWQSYRVHNVGGGFALMSVAGALSGLLGIGSGAIKVLAMDRVMKLPFKVSTTTSNFMIGVTAAASAGVYLGKGFIEPGLAAPVMLGVLVGSLIGANLLSRANNQTLRYVFSAVIGALAVQMIYKGAAGKL